MQSSLRAREWGESFTCAQPDRVPKRVAPVNVPRAPGRTDVGAAIFGVNLRRHPSHLRADRRVPRTTTLPLGRRVFLFTLTLRRRVVLVACIREVNRRFRHYRATRSAESNCASAERAPARGGEKAQV